MNITVQPGREERSHAGEPGTASRFLAVGVLVVAAFCSVAGTARANNTVDGAVQWAAAQGVGDNWDDDCGHAWAGWCLHFVGHCYSKTNTGYANALAAWNSDDGTFGPRSSGAPPRGALVFYNIALPDGHVGLSCGDGTMWDVNNNGVQHESTASYSALLGWRMPIAWIPTYVIQPGPSEGKDIWTTSVYCFCPGGGGPGGGLDDAKLVVGGWGDLYYSLLQFDLSSMPRHAEWATLSLYSADDPYSGPTGVYLDRIIEYWDWRTQGTGADRERLWWADRPAAVQWSPTALPPPARNAWYVIDITDLYNAWQSGAMPNYGLQLRPTDNWNNFDNFRSSDYLAEPSLRPKVMVPVRPADIYSNSGDLADPFVITRHGGGCAGWNVSEIQTELGLLSYGFDCVATDASTLADDFVVPDGQMWSIEQIVFYMYRTNATSPSIDSVELRLQTQDPLNDFVPSLTGYTPSVTMSGVHKAPDYDISICNYHLQQCVVTLATPYVAAPGTHYLIWQAEGPGSDSGPSVPPVVVPGAVQKPGANAMQAKNANGRIFNCLYDAGAGHPQQDLVFVLRGTIDNTQPECGQDIPSDQVHLDRLWVFDDDLHRFVDPNGPITLRLDEPTYILTHGWDGNLRGVTDPEVDYYDPADPQYSCAAIGRAIRHVDPNANILAWDWAAAANPDTYPCDSHHIGELFPESAPIPLIGALMQDVIFVDALRSGHNAVTEGNILGQGLADLLNQHGSLGTAVHLIGHSHGGGVMGVAAQIMNRLGQPASTLTTLDTPNFFGFVNTAKYTDPASVARATAFYYHWLDLLPFDYCVGVGQAAPPGATSVKLNCAAPPDSIYPHLWIDDGWYYNGTFGSVTFDGVPYTLLAPQNFPPGNFEENNLYEFASTDLDHPATTRTRDQTGWQLRTTETFDSAVAWTGTNVLRTWGADPADPNNSCIVISENGDASFFRTIDWPRYAGVMNFDYMFRDPRGDESLTVYLNDQIIYYDHAATSLATGNLMTSEMLYVGEVAATSAQLDFVLRTDGTPGGSLVLDNVRTYIIPRGDMNCDGTSGYLSFGDINPFVLYLSNFSAWQATYPGCDPTCGDINGDGTYGYLSFGDINPFVSLLTSDPLPIMCP